MATLGLVIIGQRYAVGLSIGESRPLGGLIEIVFPSYALWALFAPAIVALVRRFELPRFAAVHLLALCGFFILDGLIGTFVFPLLFKSHVVTDGERLPNAIRNLYFDFVVYGLICGLAQLLRATELRGQLAEARLSMLRAQLHPHFLFNTLNSVSELMHTDVAAAERMLAQLADLLRASLESDGARTLALADELRLVERYLQIQQVRFSDRLSFVVRAEPEALGARVPGFLLQPLVENAVRHGIAPRSRPGNVSVDCRREGAMLKVDVVDDGVGLPAALREGVGLRATRERLAGLYPGRSGLVIAGVPGGGTRSAVTLPFES
jgi:LytS/YehU family sensor histidine kinase